MLGGTALRMFVTTPDWNYEARKSALPLYFSEKLGKMFGLYWMGISLLPWVILQNIL